MFSMDKTTALVAFVGMQDPYPDNSDEPGPVLALLREAGRTGKPFDEAWLLCVGADALERARDLERECREEGQAVRILPRELPVRDVIDYSEIWRGLKRLLATVAGQAPERSWTFLLDSGTPQMKTCLLMAARSGLFPAELVQGIPARFAGGAYKVRPVRLEGLPRMVAGEETRPGASATILFEPAEAREPEPEMDLDQDGLVVRSASFAAALETSRRAARYDHPVLLLGETGTGKTLVARKIHEYGRRREEPFVELNCAAIPGGTAESELFGHERGAFTGADRNRSGRFRAASGGTLFLDEIGDLPLDLQAKLLKAIEDQQVTPVGSDKAQPVDVRLIAATHRNLSAMVEAGTFRRDLYERLKATTIRIPPLRERPEEIRPLVQRFLAQWNDQYAERRTLTTDALSLLESYPWPGNIRELRNALTSAACAVQGDLLDREALPEEIRAGGAWNGAGGASVGIADGLARMAGMAGKPGKPGQGAPDGPVDAARSPGEPQLPPGGINLKAKMLQMEWEYISAALRRHGNNREAAAKDLGMSGPALRKALKERFAAFAEEEGE